MRAAAKLNLGLEILGKRNDGYHNIKSVMQTISLFDILSFRPADEIELSCSIRSLQSEDNLVYKAADLLKKTSDFNGGAFIKLEKQIPLEAGLGGGSSDAASTLIGLNRLWSLDLPLEKLQEMAGEIGSDVPFFIQGGTCLAEGRGEKITPLPEIKTTWFVLLKPALLTQAGKTGKLYGLIRQEHYSGGEHISRLLNPLSGIEHPGEKRFYNVFDNVATLAYPGFDRYVKTFHDAGAEEIHLAGSGPVMFASFPDEKTARLVSSRLKDVNVQCFVVSSVSRSEIGYRQ